MATGFTCSWSRTARGGGVIDAVEGGVRDDTVGAGRHLTRTMPRCYSPNHRFRGTALLKQQERHLQPVYRWVDERPRMSTSQTRS